MIYIIEQLQILLYMPVIYCIPNKTQQEIENISLKKFHIFLIFPLILFFDEAQYNCHSSYSKKNIFFSGSVHLFRKHSFPKQRYFLCLICVINATIFFVHITYLKFTRKKMRKASFYSFKCPFMTCLIKTFIEQIE
jgi:hypothetical protein